MSAQATKRPPFAEPDPGWMGDPSRGASMGRASCKPEELKARKVHLQRVQGTADGAYDRGGAYWGSIYGERRFNVRPLWCAWDGEGHVLYFRAADRAEAKGQVPGAHFYR